MECMLPTPRAFRVNEIKDIVVKQLYKGKVLSRYYEIKSNFIARIK